MISVDQYLSLPEPQRVAARVAAAEYFAALFVAEAALVLRAAAPAAVAVVIKVDAMHGARFVDELVEVVDAHGAGVYVGDPEEDGSPSEVATEMLSKAARLTETWPVGVDVRVDLPGGGPGDGRR